MLEIEVESENFSLIDHGYVDDVGLYAQKLCVDYGEDPGIIKNPSGGMCLYFEKGGITECNIFYLHDVHLINVHRRAHEETHALHISGNLGLLQARLFNNNLDIRLMECNDFFKCTTETTDLVADIGSLYAMELKNADIGAIDLGICPVYFKKALTIYQNALALRSSSS